VESHGSWNRRPRSGYNVVFVRFDEGCRRAARSSCSPASSAPMATPTDAPSASRSTERARCSSRTTSATPSGG